MGFGESADFRATMAEFPTGVCAVSTVVLDDSQRAHDAIAVNSLTSISLDPPLVSICLREDSTFLGYVRRSGCWAVSVLSGSMESVARELSVQHHRRRDLGGIARWRTGPETGCPVIVGAVADLECLEYESVPMGDHVLLVGRVVRRTLNAAAPLLFHRGSFRVLADSGLVTTVDG